MHKYVQEWIRYYEKMEKEDQAVKIRKAGKENGYEPDL